MTEDNLTGNFFGALQYLPFNLALKQVLMRLVYPIESMGVLYQKTAERMGGTITGAERNLRSFRKSAKENASGYYLEKLAAFNSTNDVFYWNALRVLKAELNGEAPGSVEGGHIG